MIIETKTNKEYHSNGQLAYIETISFIEPEKINNYDAAHLRIHLVDGKPSGKCWIRTGIHAKYHADGKLAWRLDYDKLGNTIKNRHRIK